MKVTRSYYFLALLWTCISILPGTARSHDRQGSTFYDDWSSSTVECTSTITLSTQAQVDAFTCTATRDLTLIIESGGDDPITSLEGLSSLTEVLGQLSIQVNTDDESFTLQGLHNLKTIEGDLNYSGFGLRTLQGLEGLTSIGRIFRVTNTDLSSFEGLDNLTTIQESFIINSSTTLRDFTGLANLTYIGGVLRPEAAQMVSFQGLSALTSVGDIIISDTVSIKNFVGLTSLKTIQDGLIIIGPEVPVKSLVGLEQVEEIGGNIVMENLTGFEGWKGLSNLRRLGGNLTTSNIQFDNFRGLENIKAMEGNLVLDDFSVIRSMRGLDSLRTVKDIIIDAPILSLEGLEQLRQVTGIFLIYDTQLTTLAPLNDIESINELRVAGNSILSECCILPSLINRVENEVIIEDNAPGCNSFADIATRCEGAGIDCEQDIVVLSTQAEVDAFACSQVNDLVVLMNATPTDAITNLRPLQSLVTVQGNLTIRLGAGGLPSASFNSLERVGGRLLIQGNGGKTTDFTPFSRLRAIGGYLELTNGSAEDFTGFNQLLSVGGVRIRDTQVRRFVGLDSLTYIGGDFILDDTDYLRDFEGLENVETIVGKLSINNIGRRYNVNINSFQGLSSLKTVGGISITQDRDNFYAASGPEDFEGLLSLNTITGDLILKSSEARNFVGLDHVRKISGDIILTNSSPTSLEGLTRLQSVGGNITVESGALTSLQGAGALTQVVGTITLQEGASFERLDGLDRLQSVGGLRLLGFERKEISGLNALTTVQGLLEISNTTLQDISGLKKIASIGRLRIVGNSSLTACCVLPSLVRATTGPVEIANNSPSCNNPEAVAACDPPFDGIVLRTQAEVDAFALSITENLVIDYRGDRADPITDLTPLQSLTEVTGTLIINLDTSSLPLRGFENLQSVGGKLAINNGHFPDFKPFRKLRKTGGPLELNECEIDNFGGAQRLLSVGGLSLVKTKASSFTGLDHLKYINGDLRLDDVRSLADFKGLEGVAKITGQIFINSFGGPDKVNVCSFDGLSGLTALGGITINQNRGSAFNACGPDSFLPFSRVKKLSGDLILIDSDINSFAGLDNVQEILGDIRLYTTRLSTLKNLTSLRRVGGNIAIGENEQLKNYEGLDALTRVIGSITIFNNGEFLYPPEEIGGFPQLRSVGGLRLIGSREDQMTGFASLQYVRGLLLIISTRLEDISALAGIKSIDTLRIEYNYQLADCCILPSLARATRGEVTITSNGTGCNSVAEAEQSCNDASLANRQAQGKPDQTLRPEDVPEEALPEINAFPNPMVQSLHVTVPQPTTVRLYNALGILLGEYAVDQSAAIDVSAYPAGVYLLRPQGVPPIRLIKE